MKFKFQPPFMLRFELFTFLWTHPHAAGTDNIGRADDGIGKVSGLVRSPRKISTPSFSKCSVLKVRKVLIKHNSSRACDGRVCYHVHTGRLAGINRPSYGRNDILILGNQFAISAQALPVFRPFHCL